MAALQAARNAHHLPWLLRFRIGLRLVDSHSMSTFTIHNVITRRLK
jgi:hypothetical protein